jgi:glycosyltransferase involved in cell wall biosynthesis
LGHEVDLHRRDVPETGRSKSTRRVRARLLSGTMRALHRAARLRRRWATDSRPPRRSVHISPAFFAEESIVGGGERYASELAEAVSDELPTTFVSFGPRRRSFKRRELSVEIYPALEMLKGVPYDPLSFGFLRELRGANVVHCYQYKTAVTNLSVLAAAALGKLVFVTDLGGEATHFPETSPADFVDEFLAISRYSAGAFPPGRSRVIHGGVQHIFLSAAYDRPRLRRVLFVGRLLPHKGINYLIDAIDDSAELFIVGRAYDPDYLVALRQMATGKRVRFVTDALDADLVDLYSSAMVTVLPSVPVDMYGRPYQASELLGLVLLESMACGTPVVCTDVGGMPEVVEHGRTGLVVAPNDSGALAVAVRQLLDHPAQTRLMGQAGRDVVRERYTWPAVARQCVAAYRRRSAENARPRSF